MSLESVENLVSDERLARALFALLELSKALGSEVDLDSLLRVIVENASKVIDADRTSIFVYDPATERLWTRVAQGLETSTIELPLGSGIAGDVARTRNPANIHDAYADPRFNASFDQRSGYRTRSIICVPIVGSKGDLLGVIQSVNKNGGAHFDERDESLMGAIASHVAVAFERARMTEVALQNERFEQALRLASEIQMRMLPPGDAAPPDRPYQFRAHLRPAREVGGDLFDFFHDERNLFFFIGDVSGKGVGAALVMAMTKTLFRATAGVHESPGLVLESMSARLYEETDPAMFVTAFFGVLDLESGHLRYASAGHDRPFLISATGDSVTPLDLKPGLPLGVFPSFQYTVLERTLAPGEALFLYTDGVTEATNDRDELLGTESMVEAVHGAAGGEPAAVVGHVIATVERFAGGAPQSDDITVMCIRYLSH